MRRFIIGTLLLALCILVGPLAGEALAACTTSKSTAYDNPLDSDSSSTTSGSSAYAQSFTLPTAVTLNKLSLYLQNAGGTVGITVEIRSDSAGSPGAVLGSRSAAVADTNLSFVDFDFSADHISLAAATTYYVVAHSPHSYGWGTDTTSPTYPRGQGYTSADGTTWDPQSGGYDFLFRVFGQTCTADAPPGGGPPPALASVSGLAFSNTTFAAEGSGPPATNARKKKPHRGTKVSFKLNEGASVRFTVTRRAKGRRVKRGKKKVCVKPTRKNRKRKRCTRVITLKGSFSRSGVAGKNSFHFSGRLRGRKLKPGRYRLVATPTAGGQKGKPASKSFRIVR